VLFRHYGAKCASRGCVEDGYIVSSREGSRAPGGKVIGVEWGRTPRRELCGEGGALAQSASTCAQGRRLQSREKVLAAGRSICG